MNPVSVYQRDNEKLIHSLEQLRDLGNSVIVVEHDKDMIERADYVIDIGPKRENMEVKLLVLVLQQKHWLPIQLRHSI
jgi:ABC-type lipoprotein export system ATPase subunit